MKTFICIPCITFKVVVWEIHFKTRAHSTEFREDNRKQQTMKFCPLKMFKAEI